MFIGILTKWYFFIYLNQLPAAKETFCQHPKIQSSLEKTVTFDSKLDHQTQINLGI